MKQLMATFLRGRTTWQLVAIAAVLVSLALFMSLWPYQSTVRALKPALIVLYGTGVAALILALVRRGEDVQKGGPALRMWLTLLAGILGIAGAIGFATYSLAYFGDRLQGTCNGALLPDTYAEREAALAAAEAKLASPRALLTRLVDGAVNRDCANARRDFERTEQGLCTEFMLVDRPCKCGEENYPYARCKEPTCMSAPGLPDRFDCVGDTIPPGYLVPR